MRLRISIPRSGVLGSVLSSYRAQRFGALRMIARGNQLSRRAAALVVSARKNARRGMASIHYNRVGSTISPIASGRPSFWRRSTRTRVSGMLTRIASGGGAKLGHRFYGNQYVKVFSGKAGRGRVLKGLFGLPRTRGRSR